MKLVFFFGGGWKSGSASQFVPQSEMLAKRGMVAMVADYRVASRHKTKAKDCVKQLDAFLVDLGWLEKQ